MELILRERVYIPYLLLVRISSFICVQIFYFRLCFYSCLMSFNAAVCLDGTLPGYHFHPGSGSGAKRWLINLEVCDKSCVQLGKVNWQLFV